MTNAYPLFFVQVAESLALFDEHIASLSVTKHPGSHWSFTVSLDSDDHVRGVAQKLGIEVRVIDEPHFRAVVCEHRVDDSGTRVHMRFVSASNAPVAIPSGAWRPGAWRPGDEAHA